MECGQKGEEKDTQASPLADLQEVFVGLQSACDLATGVCRSSIPHATPQRVFVDLQSAHATLQGVFVGHQSAMRPCKGYLSVINQHAISQGVFVDLQPAHVTS